MAHLTCGFIGLGLIGGSIAKALKQSDAAIKIIAFDTNKDTLLLAHKEGVADIITEQMDENFSQCDYLFLCAPVQKNNSNLSSIKEITNPHCLITDVGSVKTAIHEAICSFGLESRFIGGHPMAGSERMGYINSKASLLENAYYILTPTASVPGTKLEEYRNLVLAMGAIPLVLDYRKHDYVTAAISHLPHVIASSLVNLIHDSDSEDGIMKMVAAGGFKDITRIASSSAQMWQQICLTNGSNISSLLTEYIKTLMFFQKAIEEGDETVLYQLFDGARIYRDSFINVSSGPIKSSHRIYVDIADHAGTLASVTSLLSDHLLNIKNIGITHNRESEDGVLKLEFYDETAMTKAANVLTQAGYSVTACS